MLFNLVPYRFSHRYQRSCLISTQISILSSPRSALGNRCILFKILVMKKDKNCLYWVKVSAYCFPFNSRINKSTLFRTLFYFPLLNIRHIDVNSFHGIIVRKYISVSLLSTITLTLQFILILFIR